MRAIWPLDDREFGILRLELQPDRPLIDELAIGDSLEPEMPLLKGVDPVTLVTVGTRDLRAQGAWVAFFDDPPKRPHETFLASLEKKAVRFETHGNRSTIIIDGLTAGPFKGDLRFTLYPGSRLVQVQAVVSTDKDACAIVYDGGLTSGARPAWKSVAWFDTSDHLQRVDAVSADPARQAAAPLASRNRAIVAECDNGSVAIFPPPHQFLYPLDFADNFKYVWHGKGWQQKVDGYGIGVRQPPEGDKRHVPWMNAPPHTEQRLGVFYLLSRGKAEDAMEQVRLYTHGDKFKKLDGYLTFTSHYHIEHTLHFVEAQKQQKTTGIPRGMEEPGFVKAFKSAGVDIVHLAEFHVNRDEAFMANRLPLLKTLHSECDRLSDDRFLLLPGEEPNLALGGHWISLFPKPVYWTLERKKEQPFSEEIEGYGTVYHAGDSADVLRLMERENGLMWTAHPRIKSSFGFPDVYRHKDYFLSDHFLGAAWKAMPADASLPRLGVRSLDLMDDMANWGLRKYVLGEVDIFQVNPDYELYGHMNVNYLKLDRLPHYRDGWQPVLDTLRQGRFFVTTGEVLIPSFTIGGKEAGQTVKRPADSDAPLVMDAKLEWTFPLAFAEVISGDGEKVYRQHIDLSDTGPFGTRELHVPVPLAGRKWVRLEVWDIATNGAFTEPVWVE